MSAPAAFPADWTRALVLVPHPDDPEYGIAAAVAKWTAAGKDVRYALACRGEAGIAGMAPERAGPLREAEQRRSAAIVGVDRVDFWEFPDSAIENTAALRAAIADVLAKLRPELVVTIYGGERWSDEVANQRDHIEFAAAVAAVFDESADPPRWLFANSPAPTHAEIVDGYTDAAIAALAAHRAYLSVLDPATPVAEQARAQIEAVTAEVDGHRRVGFELLRGH